MKTNHKKTQNNGENHKNGIVCRLTFAEDYEWLMADNEILNHYDAQKIKKELANMTLDYLARYTPLRDALIFQHHCIDGDALSILAHRHHLSPRQICRILNKVKRDIRNYIKRSW